jgi:ERCC4-type nuclease
VEKIKLMIDSNERGSSRAQGLVQAAGNDPRFEAVGYFGLPVDARFFFNRDSEQPLPGAAGRLVLNVELKGPADFVSSALGGRLYTQILAMRELQQPGMVVVLGSDDEVQCAILAYASKKSKGDDDLDGKVTLFSKLLQDFEANAYALGIPIFRWKNEPYKRLLSHAHKLLSEGNLIAHMPKPADGERQIAALCMLAKGIGMKKAKTVLEGCGCIGDLSSLCRNDDQALRTLPGIGPTLAKRIRGALWKAL